MLRIGLQPNASTVQWSSLANLIRHCCTLSSRYFRDHQLHRCLLHISMLLLSRFNAHLCFETNNTQSYASEKVSILSYHEKSQIHGILLHILWHLCLCTLLVCRSHLAATQISNFVTVTNIQSSILYYPVLVQLQK